MVAYQFIFFSSFVFLSLAYGYLIAVALAGVLLNLGVSAIWSTIIGIVFAFVSSEILSPMFISVSKAITKSSKNVFEFLKNKKEDFEISKFNKVNGLFKMKGA